MSQLKTMFDANVVAEWEKREEQFRTLIADARKGYDERIQAADKLVKQQDDSIARLLAVIEYIRSIPIIGNWLVQRAFNNPTSSDFVLIYTTETEETKRHITHTHSKRGFGFGLRKSSTRRS
jgi:hypothetical protein